MNGTPQNVNRRPLSVVTAILVLCTIIFPLFGNSASEAYVPELQNRIKSVEQKNTPVDLKKWFFNPYYHWVLRYYYDEIASDITVFRNSDMDDITYHYDANGNLKQRITTAGIEEIIYNPRNQPVAILKNGTKVASFTYDSIGMRNRSLDLETGKQQDYLREGRKVLAEMDGKGANRKVYRYGNGPMGYVANGLPQFTSRDPVGSPFAVSSATGRFLETRQYEPFGASTAMMDSVDDYPDVHIHFQQNTIADSTPIGDIGTIDPDPKTGTVTADLPLDGAAGDTYEPELFLTIGDNPETTHLPVHQVPLIMVTDLPPPYLTLEADKLVFGPTTTDPVTYTLTIEPVGNTFNDVIITIPLPKTVEYNSTISGQGPTHDPITNTLTWNYNQLNGTQTIVFTITVDFIKNYDTWLDLQATLTATELFDTNRLSNTASTAIYSNGLVSLITPKADFDPSFTNKPTAYALLDSDPLATEQTITCDYTIKLLGETSQNTQTFVGKETDPTTGLMYFGARFYDPVIGRFISEDSYVGSINEPHSLMRYSYGFNNPLTFVDLYGLANRKFVELLTGQKIEKVDPNSNYQKFTDMFGNDYYIYDDYVMGPTLEMQATKGDIFVNAIPDMMNQFIDLDDPFRFTRGPSDDPTTVLTFIKGIEESIDPTGWHALQLAIDQEYAARLIRERIWILNDQDSLQWELIAQELESRAQLNKVHAAANAVGTLTLSAEVIQSIRATKLAKYAKATINRFHTDETGVLDTSFSLKNTENEAGFIRKVRKPSNQRPSTKYDKFVTRRGYEEVWEVNGEIVHLDAIRDSVVVEAKWTGNQRQWATSPYNPTHAFYDEAKILDQARRILEFRKSLGLKHVDYAISNLEGRTHFEQLFRAHFPKEMETGVLRIWHVEGKGM